jgi:hypothetical protein
MWPVFAIHIISDAVLVLGAMYSICSPLDLVRRSEDGAVTEHVHVGDVGPKMEHHLRSKCN